MLTKTDILSSPNAESCEIEGLGMVRIRKVSGEEYDYITEPTNSDMVRIARAIVCCLCNADDTPMFDRSDVSDIMAMPVDRLNLIAEALMEYAGIKQPDQEEALGNSEATTLSSSGTS